MEASASTDPSVRLDVSLNRTSSRPYPIALATSRAAAASEEEDVLRVLRKAASDVPSVKGVEVESWTKGNESCVIKVSFSGITGSSEEEDELVEAVIHRFSSIGFPTMRSPSSSRKQVQGVANDDHATGSSTVAPVVHAVLNIKGMTCASCTGTVRQILESTLGVVAGSVVVSLAEETATLRYDRRSVSRHQLAEKIEGAGFSVVVLSASQVAGAEEGTVTMEGLAPLFVKTDFAVHGMTCASCVGSLTSTLETLPGVVDVTVTLLPQKAVIIHDATHLTPAQLASHIQDIGYEALDWETVPVPTKTNKDGHVDVVVEDPGSIHVTTTRFIVAGMTCASCVAAIEKNMRKVAGVRDVTVNLITGQATIKHNIALVGIRDLIGAISELGYDTTLAPKTNRDTIARNRDRKELNHLATRTAIAFCFALPTVILSMVFSMALPESSSVRMAMMKEIRPGLTVVGLISFLLATPVQFGLGAKFYKGAYKSLTKTKSANMDVLVALGTSTAYGYSVYAVVADMVERNASSDKMYFETAVLLIFFILLGKFLEAFAKGKTSEAITKLMALAPSQATLITLDPVEGRTVVKEQIVDIALVQVGDVLRVTAGSRVPCDGILLRGEKTFVDESMLTGEAKPVAKSEGDPLLGATVNASGPFLMRARKVGAETMLSSIVRLVEDAQTAKAPIQAVADKVAQYFVPCVVLAAVVTLLAWIAALEVNAVPDDWIDAGTGEGIFALNFAIAVLVIACPCALGLATPTAVMVGTGVAAKYGIMVKGGGAALESAHGVSVVAFDKTGTLTQGRPSVTDHHIFDAARSSKDFWTLILAVEGQSTHPLARAVVMHAVEQVGIDPMADAIAEGRMTVGSLDEVAGKGLSCTMKVQTKTGETVSWCIKIGSARFVLESCRYMSEEDQTLARAMTDAWTREAKSLVFAGMVDASLDPSSAEGVGRMLGMIAIADPVRPEARQVVEALGHRGLDVWMITGDSELTARAVGFQLGIPSSRILAQVMPSEKAEKVKFLQEGTTGRVAMTGDGINDSVALAQADVGIAIATGSDVAIESAAVVLMKSDLRDVLILLDLSRVVFRRIQLNFAWAFGYNILGIPLAAGCLYPGARIVLAPWMAGLAMAASSVCVLTSSLALRLYTPPRGAVV
ncbi:serine/threonine protein kinase Ran1 [Thoreauomyces humboldtii]|nr:serine/threonine protein kinase Ran1 [Thoreauomyces humboldtii]